MDEGRWEGEEGEEEKEVEDGEEVGGWMQREK